MHQIDWSLMHVNKQWAQTKATSVAVATQIYSGIQNYERK